MFFIYPYLKEKLKQVASIFATGVSGTIGKHFKNRVFEIHHDLKKPTIPTIPSFKNGDCILHAAAVVGPYAVNRDPIISHHINVRGSQMLAEFAKSRGVSRFIYVSTSHVYARSKSCLTETSSTDPINIYAEQKLEAEELISRVFSETPEKLCIVRVFSVLDWDVADFTLGGAIKKLISNNSDFILNNGDDIRDFLTPRQVADALIAIANNQNLSGIVNLSTGNGLSVKSAAKKMLEVRGYLLPDNRISSGTSEYPYVVGDNSKLKSSLPSLNLVWNPARSEF